MMKLKAYATYLTCRGNIASDAYINRKAAFERAANKKCYFKILEAK